MTTVDMLHKLKMEMAAAHPDRGGTNAAFHAARQRYVAAKRQLATPPTHSAASVGAWAAIFATWQTAYVHPESEPPRPPPVRARLSDDAVRREALRCGRDGRMPSPDFLGALDARQARIFKEEVPKGRGSKAESRASRRRGRT